MGAATGEAKTLEAGGASPGPELLVDESFLLHALRDVVQHWILSAASNDASEAGQEDGREVTPEDLESRLETLWDLCVDARTAAFLVRSRAVSILSEAAARAQASERPRCAEICLGALGNVCSHAEVATCLGGGDAAALVGAALAGLGCGDGAVVLQALRLACALLSGPAAGDCAGLWSDAAITSYLFVLESSLLWDAVRHACDALSQVLVLAADEESGVASSQRPEAQHLVERLAQEHLLASLASRLGELTAAAAAEVEGATDAPEGEGDVEAAVLSGLCLADSFATAAPSLLSEAASPLASACLRVLARLWRPEVLAAALELLASLLEGEGGGREEVDTDVYGPVLGQVRAFASGAAGAGLVERLVLVLEDREADETVVATALAVLEHAPAGLVAEHRELLASAAAARLQRRAGAASRAEGASPSSRSPSRERSRSPPEGRRR